MRLSKKIDELLARYKEKKINDALVKVDTLLNTTGEDDVEEESYITSPQKMYKPIDRLSRSMRIIKKLRANGELPWLDGLVK